MSAPTVPPPTGATGWADVAGRGLGPTRGWRLPLVMALRDLRRHPGRTAAAAVMVLVPVLAASVVTVGLATSDVSAAERVIARMGAADAVVVPDEFTAPPEEPYTAAQIADRVGVPVVEVRVASGSLRVDGDAAVAADVLATDWQDPATDGVLVLREGQLPTGDGELALSPGAATDLGVGVGDDVSLELGETAGTVVTGTVTGLTYQRWTSPTQGLAVVPGTTRPAAVADTSGSWWLLPDAEGVDVRVPDFLPGLRLVGRGSAEDYTQPFEVGTLGGVTTIVLAVALALVVLEIALLAGPAFAVGVRQQQQTLALLAATGGDGRALRRVVLAQAVVVGAGAALLGAALGTGLAVLAIELARNLTDLSFGPLEVRWGLVAGFVAVGVVSAVASALVPALGASRATVVGALAPRTSSRRLPWRRPLLGLLLLGGGTGLLRAAARNAAGDSAITGAFAVLVMGVGMVLVVPLPVALLGRVTTRLPLGVRLAGRESTRAATRSVAAVAAVAGASAALVAGLTVTAAVRTQDADSYVPRSTHGVTTLPTSFTGVTTDDVVDRVRAASPDARLGLVGDPGHEVRPDGELYRSFWLPSPGCETPPAPLTTDTYDECWSAWAGPSGQTSAVVLDGDAAELRGYDLTQAQRSVLDGDGVLLSESSTVDVSGGTVPVGVGEQSYPSDEAATAAPVRVVDLTVATWRPPEALTGSSDGSGPPSLLLGPDAAAALGVRSVTDVLVLPPAVDTTSTPEQVGTATAPVLGAVPAATARSAWTEVGYQDSYRVVDVVILLVSALVVLGATFTATALALADARRDRTVLTALGASPSTQRVAAGSTAALVAGTGALVGTAVGLVVGLVVADAVLVSGSVVQLALGLGSGARDAVDPLVGEVPWGWVTGFVVGLPVLAGLVVAAVARGRPDAEAAALSARVG